MSQLQDLVALIQADTPLIVIETPDEQRVVELFRQTLTQVWQALYRWSTTEGLRRLDLDREDESEVAPDALSEFQLHAELKQARPLSVLMREQVQALREWARERTVPAD